MDAVLYEKPLKIELVGYSLFVDGKTHPRSVRTMEQMKGAMMRYREEAANLEMYYMYRSVHKAEDVRFDITVIPPLEVGGECAKTHGHYHPAGDDGTPYPEVYQVLRGNGVFVLQKKNRNAGSVDVMAVHAKTGDTILLPPGFGHVSVNTGDEPLVLSNLVYDKFEPIYDDYTENQGAAIYYLKGGELAQNTNYMIKRSESLKAEDLNRRYGFSCRDLLSEFYSDPHKFAFLQKPKMLFKE